MIDSACALPIRQDSAACVSLSSNHNVKEPEHTTKLDPEPPCENSKSENATSPGFPARSRHHRECCCPVGREARCVSQRGGLNNKRLRVSTRFRDNFQRLPSIWANAFQCIVLMAKFDCFACGRGCGYFRCSARNAPKMRGLPVPRNLVSRCAAGRRNGSSDQLTSLTSMVLHVTAIERRAHAGPANHSHRMRVRHLPRGRPVCQE